MIYAHGRLQDCIGATIETRFAWGHVEDVEVRGSNNGFQVCAGPCGRLGTNVGSEEGG